MNPFSAEGTVARVPQIMINVGRCLDDKDSRDYPLGSRRRRGRSRVDEFLSPTDRTDDHNVSRHALFLRYISKGVGVTDGRLKNEGGDKTMRSVGLKGTPTELLAKHARQQQKHNFALRYCCWQLKPIFAHHRRRRAMRMKCRVQRRSYHLAESWLCLSSQHCNRQQNGLFYYKMFFTRRDWKSVVQASKIVMGSIGPQHETSLTLYES